MNLGSVFKRSNQNIRTTENVKTSDSVTRGERLYKLQSEIRSMKPGQTLQGTVVSRSGNTVQIALSQELSVNAKIDQSISLTLGQLMSFEIKANNGSLLSLSPLYTNTANAEMIMRALIEAGLPENADNVKMVESMMEEGMPIDRESILSVSRQLLEFPGQDPSSVIQMIRLGLPVTETDIEQFEQYRNANHQLLGSAETIMNELPEVFTELLQEGKMQQAAELYRNILDIFAAEQEDPVILYENAAPEEMPDAGMNGAERETVETPQAADKGTEAQTAQEILRYDASGQTAQTEADGGILTDGNKALTAQAETSPLTKQQWNALSDLLKELGVEEAQTEQIRQGETTTKEVLRLIREFMPKDGAGAALSRELGQVLHSREFQTLLKAEMENQWLIKPGDVADPDKVKQLYERVREQSARLHEALQAVDKGGTAAAKSVQNLQNNMDFMNKMNHVFTYVQLPLKMAGNNAHGDLYVYTNKKSLAAKDGNVSALLHLDMEHLGPMDVYVTMQSQKVNTNFTLSDESAIELIEQHIGLLDERLAKRGYDMKAQFQVRETEEDAQGIMQTILNQDKNISVLSRTSFDMRA
ncbi:MAG: flagellar hook-length control protein FliK [Lachnospiraceae bacterium]|nr:flagellar hook-length control protein FliK [Lachnospiraceae bacterium]